MSKFTSSLLCIVAASLAVVSAITEDEFALFHHAISPIIVECSEEHQVTRSDIEAAKQSKDASGITSCFIACVFKKTEVLDSNGFFDAQSSLTKLQLIVETDEEFKMFTGVADKCNKVNLEAVSDGAAGCDRARLLLQCGLDHLDEMPL